MAILDRIMEGAAGEKPVPSLAAEPTKNPHAGAAAVVKDGLDETAELFKTVFKGEIVP